MKINQKKICGICGGMLALLLAAIPKIILQAETSEHINSKGIIRYVDNSGGEVIFDAGDLEMLFQSAAEGKNGMLEALSGVGTKLWQTEEGWQYSRNPQIEVESRQLCSAAELESLSFSLLVEALADSQKLPTEYMETYSLATSDNLTLGNAAWADGSLLLGNNHDLLENYARGWMEGAGYTQMFPIQDEKGNIIGYRFE